METREESIFYIELPNKVQGPLTWISSNVSNEVYNILDLDRIYQICVEEWLIWSVIFLDLAMKWEFCISLEFNYRLSIGTQEELKKVLIELNKRVFNWFQ